MARSNSRKKLVLAAVVVAAVFVAVLVALSQTLPSKILVERSILVEAGPAATFPLVNRLKNWEQWSPWKEIDPEMEFRYQGPEAGAGAVSVWVSERSPSGRQIIVTSVPDRQVELAIDFGDQGRARGEFLFEETGGDPGQPQTRLTWKMEMEMGQQPFGRFLVPAMRGELERAYNRGLVNLKRVAEGG